MMGRQNRWTEGYYDSVSSQSLNTHSSDPWQTGCAPVPPQASIFYVFVLQTINDSQYTHICSVKDALSPNKAAVRR